MASPIHLVEIDVRDPATGTDPVALVTRHLDTGATVAVHDSLGAFPRFILARRSASVLVTDEAGASLATYADVWAALHHGLTQWSSDLVSAAEAAVTSTWRPRRPRRTLARMVARLNRSARHAA